MSSLVAFWSIATLIVLVALGVLLRALLARHPAAAPATDGASIAIFRDEKRALDDDLANGVIDAAEHARARDELARRLGHEVEDLGEATPEPATGQGRRPLLIAAALIVLLPLGATALYLAIGRPATLVAANPAAGRPTTQADVLAMVDTLARRMRSNPADPHGWALLGRSYASLGRYDDSLRAFAEAAARAPADATILADYADVLSLTRGSLQGKPSELIDRALAADPHSTKALALGASAAAERGDYDLALARWRTLAAGVEPGSDTARELAGVIADLEHKRDAARATAAPAPPGANAPVAATPPAAPAAATGSVSGDVALAPQFAARVAPTDTVFIFARATDGRPMPLAVLRTTVGELPRAFTLDDSMAMAPGATLSSAREVVVEARVSKSGNAMPATGDLVGRSPPVRPGTANIHVRIDRVNP
jgi:cytochrome c-type biogenesis protein CcmH